MFRFLGNGFTVFWKGVQRAEKDYVGYITQESSL